MEFKQVLEALGIDRAVAAGSAFGALLSLHFVEKSRSATDKTVVVIGGFITAYEVTPAIVHAFSVSDGSAGGVGFGLGLFGMNLIAAIYGAIKDGTLLSIVRGRIGQ